jgi:hypothetical protein
MYLRRAAVGVLIGCGALTAVPLPGWAQMPGGVMPGMNGGFQPMVRPDQPTAKPAPTPAALPGATPGRGAAPADKSVADLPPNEALFDAINRGDIAAAREAVNRGADINAQNVLGMTPLEVSVDLSRNDITFFLLSLRGASGGALSNRLATLPAAAPASAPAPPAPGTKPAGKRPQLAVKAAAPKPSPAVPRQYAGSADPGRPDPQMGFLGFGPSSP